MESIVREYLLHNWQRKLVALLTAIIIWLFVNHSISATKIIANVPIHIINLPPDKTIQGLLPNGMLMRRVTLTLTGSKDVVDDLESGDLEVLLDASTSDSDEWVVQISKKNLVSLNPSIDLSQHISQVSHPDLIIKLSKLVTARIPLSIQRPKGKAPQGFEYLDVWPQYLYQTVSGPEEEIQKLKEEGLELIFDLNEISRADLEAVKTPSISDEISYMVPKKWKQIPIPFHNNNYEELNDPDAQNLSIDFLRQEFLPLDKEIPISIFFPANELSTVNPSTLTLIPNNDIEMRDGVTFFTKPLYVKAVSRLFIEVVRNSLEIVITAAPKEKREVLAWSLQFINPRNLEDTYIAFAVANSPSMKGLQGLLPKKKEEMLRRRFREYVQHFTLFLVDSKKLHLKNTIEGNLIRIIAY